MKALKIAITGVESTGKTTLASQLSNYFQTTYIPEFARSYLQNLKEKYTKENLIEIAEGQINSQNQAHIDKELKNIRFYDTELTTIKIWYETLYGDLPAHLQLAYLMQVFDYYLLPYPDLEWEADELREHPNEQARYQLFDKYEQALKALNRPYAIIKGYGQARLNNATAVITAHFQLNSEN